MRMYTRTNNDKKRTGSIKGTRVRKEERERYGKATNFKRRNTKLHHSHYTCLGYILPTLSSMYSHKLCNRQFVKKRPKSGSKFNFLCSVLISLQLHCCIHVSCFKMTDVSRSEFVMNQNFVGEILYKYMYMHEWNSMTGIERPCPFQSSEELLQVQSKL